MCFCPEVYKLSLSRTCIYTQGHRVGICDSSQMGVEYLASYVFYKVFQSNYNQAGHI